MMIDGTAVCTEIDTKSLDCLAPTVAGTMLVEKYRKVILGSSTRAIL